MYQIKKPLSNYMNSKWGNEIFLHLQYTFPVVDINF